MDYMKACFEAFYYFLILLCCLCSSLCGASVAFIFVSLHNIICLMDTVVFVYQFISKIYVAWTRQMSLYLMLANGHSSHSKQLRLIVSVRSHSMCKSISISFVKGKNVQKSSLMQTKGTFWRKFYLVHPTKSSKLRSSLRYSHRNYLTANALSIIKYVNIVFII